jgi:aminotransferase
MTRTSQLVGELEPSGIRDFFEMVMGMDDVISLGVGEPDFVTPWHIRNSAIQSLENGQTNYTSNKGLGELRETLSDHLQEKHDLSYSPEKELLITTGVSEAMDLAMRALINPGDEVLIPSPSYISYVPTARMAGGSVNLIETASEDEFRLEPSTLADAISPESKILCLNYPANPTGATYSKQTLEAIGDIVKSNDLLVISDEIYSDLTFEQNHVSLASIPGLSDRTILLDGFSKAYAMTGFRVGYAAGPDDLISTMTKIHQYTMLSAPTPSQFAAIEALINGDRAVKNMREEYRQRRDLVVHRLRGMDLKCVEPDGGFYAFPSIETTGLNSRTFCESLLEEEKVAVVPGSAFGDSGEGHIRLSFATDRDRLNKALNRMEEFINSCSESSITTSESPVSESQ